MLKRTTIELDEDLLSRARDALGTSTTRATVEVALRKATEGAEALREHRRIQQLAMLDTLSDSIDTRVLASGEMWR